MQGKRDREEMLQDFIAGFETLKGHEDCTGKVGVVGFCFGGWVSNMMAVRAYMYPEVNHGFHNHSTPRYDEAAAKLAWGRTIDFFREKLR